MVGENLILFPTKVGPTVPAPIYARPGETFPYIVIEDHSYEHIGLFVGCVVVFWPGKLREKMLHLIETDKGPALGWLTMQNLFDVRVQSANPRLLPSGIYKLTELDVRGSEVERWPQGLVGSRVIVWADDRAFTSATSPLERPLLIANN